MVMENATVPLAIASVFGSFTGNPIKPVGVLRLVVIGASYLKYPKGKGNVFIHKLGGTMMRRVPFQNRLISIISEKIYIEHKQVKVFFLPTLVFFPLKTFFLYDYYILKFDIN